MLEGFSRFRPSVVKKLRTIAVNLLRPERQRRQKCCSVTCNNTLVSVARGHPDTLWTTYTLKNYSS